MFAVLLTFAFALAPAAAPLAPSPRQSAALAVACDELETHLVFVLKAPVKTLTINGLEIPGDDVRRLTVTGLAKGEKKSVEVKVVWEDGAESSFDVEIVGGEVHVYRITKDQ